MTTAGEIVFITAADTELLSLAAAARRLPPGALRLRAFHVRDLPDEEALRRACEGAAVVVARILGGYAYFREGFDLLARRAREGAFTLLALPGSGELDPDLARLGTAPPAEQAEVLAYLVHGGPDNTEQLLRYLGRRFLGLRWEAGPPRATPRRGVHEPAELPPVPADAPRVGILFYRAHWLSGNLRPIDALARALQARGCRARAVFCDSLQETDADGTPLAVRELLGDSDLLVSTLAFTGGHGLDTPVLQAILAGSSREAWEASTAGLAPVDVAMHVALPEFDGRIIGVPLAFKEAEEDDPQIEARPHRNAPLADRVDALADLARAWCELRRTPNASKRVAILFNNYPTRNARVGNGVGLDTPESVVRLLRALADAGYHVGPVPEDGDALMRALLAGCTQDEEFQTPEQLERCPQVLAMDRYAQAFRRLPAERAREMSEQWGPPPGTCMLGPRGFAVPGLQFGNVFVGIQPARGYGKDSRAIYHSPDLPPTHYYLAYYTWIREVFGAHAVVHAGKHGNLEWLPGKGTGLGRACYPEVLLGSLPNIYPYVINNPGEGTQAKRRGHAVIVDHLIPPMTRAEAYGELVELEQLADEYAQVSVLDPAKMEILEAKILDLAQRSEIYRDLAYPRPPTTEELDDFLQAFDGYLCEIKESQIRDGLHVLGACPDGERLIHLLVALVRLDQSGVRGLPAAVAEDLGLDLEALLADPAKSSPRPGLRTAGDAVEEIERLAAEAVRTGRPLGPRSAETLRFVEEEVRPRLARTGDEIGSILAALEGRFVEPGPSGAPTRGMATILPTGRNFYSVDVRAIPTATAFDVGRRAAEGVLERFHREQGRYPECIGMVVWGTSNMRTGGDDVAEILHLLGVRPVWEPLSRRVTGIEVVPLEELGRPRIDVLVRISGFFRDAFPGLVSLLDQAVHRVAALEEPPEHNFLRARWLEECRRGADPEGALRRIFGSKPGSYGAGLLPLLDERNWRTDGDLTDVYVSWGGYAYGAGRHGEPAFDAYRERLARVQVALQNQDNREHDIFDSDDYFQFHGGMIAAVRQLSGSSPTALFGDTSRPERVRVRSLQEEAYRVFRARVVNPKWIASMLRHGHRGAAELAATVDYLFGYDATARVVDDWMYERTARAFLLDPEVRRVLEEKNPGALRGMAERLLEAHERGLWEHAPEDLLADLSDAYLAGEALLEGEDA